MGKDLQALLKWALLFSSKALCKIPHLFPKDTLKECAEVCLQKGLFYFTLFFDLYGHPIQNNLGQHTTYLK